MTIAETSIGSTGIERDVHSRRLWYHDIELDGGLRTRFPEDYAANPVLRRVDRSNKLTLAWLDTHLARDFAGMTVLDPGCADGLFTFWAARRGARRVLGIERNRPNFDRADWLRDTLGLDNVELRLGGVERELPSEEFDVVMCLGLLYHLINPLGTLHELRRRCTGRLLLTSAVDLQGNAGEPISRLDRYVTGAHGLWSFNVEMIRQLLSTAGFDITEDSVEADGTYHAVATPGDFADHHIFAETIDQPFPIDVTQRREAVRTAWRRLAEESDRPVALFGAGTHTPWLLDQVSDIDGVTVACVLDDRIPEGGKVAGLPVLSPEDVDPNSFHAVVLSSWHQIEPLRRRAVELFGDRVKVISLET